MKIRQINGLSNEFIVNSRSHLNKYNKMRMTFDYHSILFNQEIETFDDLMVNYI